MRVVLYTRDMEPITIIDMPTWLLEQVEKVGMVRVAVRDPVQGMRNGEPFQEPDTLDIYCEKLRWRDGTLKSILVVSNDELALAVNPQWLPGQQQAINWYEKVIRQLVSELERHFKKKNLDP